MYTALYGYDSLMVGSNVAIDDAISALTENGLVLKIMDGLKDSLFCKIKFSMDERRAWLRQTCLIKHLDKKFSKHVKDVCSHKTPGAPKFLLIRPIEESEKISAEDKWEYQLGVGMLWTYQKTFKDLLCLKYVMDMKNIGLKIEPMENSNKPRKIVCFSDSNYVGDWAKKEPLVASYLCKRCTSFWMIKVGEKCVTFQLRCRACCLC